MRECGAACRPSFNKRARRLVLKCPEEGLGGDLAEARTCRGRAIYLLSNVPAEELVIRSRVVRKVYEGDILHLLRSYAEALSNVKWSLLDIKLLQSCKGSSSCLEARKDFLQELLSLKPPFGKLYSDPLTALINVEEELSKLSTVPHSSPYCGRCLRSYKGVLKKLKRTLSSTALVKHLERAYRKIGVVEAAYIQVLKASRVEAAPWSYEEKTGLKGGTILDEYEVPPFLVRIMYLNPVEKLYVPKLALSSWERSLVGELVRTVKASSSYVYGLVRDRLSLLMEIKRREIRNALHELWLEGFKKLSRVDRVVEASVYKSLGLLKIAPFLLDDQVEEFFLDKPSTYIYLNHTQWGRCRSSVTLSGRDVERIVTHLKAESGRSVDYEHPSLKCELITPSFHVRASVDLPPLAVDGPALDFRKLRKKFWTLPELVANGTLTSELAAYLIFCLFRRRNITVVGEPNTGKTTLVNALDLCTPPHWRKVYVEDVTESLSQANLGKHQLRLRVDPLESGRKSFTKSLEVLKLLHRSPDIVVLSEIQTPEHTRALFQALGAGVRGLQTCHASTIDGLLRRWTLHHGIHPVNILDLDILVLMKLLQVEGREFRRVVKVCEVEPQGDGFKLVDVFSWVPGIGLARSMDLYEAPTVLKVREYESFTRKRFQEEISAYRSIIEEMARTKPSLIEVSSKFTELYFTYVA